MESMNSDYTRAFLQTFLKVIYKHLGCSRVHLNFISKDFRTLGLAPRQMK